MFGEKRNFVQTIETAETEIQGQEILKKVHNLIFWRLFFFGLIFLALLPICIISILALSSYISEYGLSSALERQLISVLTVVAAIVCLYKVITAFVLASAYFTMKKIYKNRFG